MQEVTLEEKVQRSLDYQEIQNVIAAHTYYYRAQMQWQELETVWAKEAPDIVYAHDERAFIGRKAVAEYYGENNERMRREKLAMVSKVFPEVKNIRENEGVGDLVIHLLTTPYIEIARDGKTAKGVWYSPGLCSEVDADGELVIVSIWERYGVDFIKENGKWKIWHFRTFGDFMFPVDKDLLAGPKTQPQRTVSGGPQPNRELSRVEHYSPKTVPRMAPALPEPYDTWDDSLSYVY